MRRKPDSQLFGKDVIVGHWLVQGPRKTCNACGMEGVYHRDAVATYTTRREHVTWRARVRHMTAINAHSARMPKWRPESLSVGHLTKQFKSIPHVQLNTITVDGVNVLYRPAGLPATPVLVLLSAARLPNLSIPIPGPHPAPSPQNSASWRLICPGSASRRCQRSASLSVTIEAFLDALGVDKFAVYIFDYGIRTLFSVPFPMFHRPRVQAPTAFRIAVR
jgi:hypothetical protein